MSAISNLTRNIEFVRDHSRLIKWYLRNRVRQAGLGFEQKRSDGTSRFPRGITLKPTLACNLKCKMCAFALGNDELIKPGESLPVDAWLSLIDDAAPHRPYFTLTGGEPTLYRDFPLILRQIKKHGLFCSMTTNGTLLSKRAHEIIDHPPDALIVSLDGPKDIHEEIRGLDGCFERSIDGIQTVLSLKRSRKSKQPFVIINCSVTTFNYTRVEEMVDIAHDLGVGALNYQLQWSLTPKMIDAHNKLYGKFHRLACDSSGTIDLPPTDPAEVADVVRRIRRTRESRNGKMYITFHPDLTDEEVVHWYTDPHKWVRRTTPACAWINTDILPNGDVEPCPSMVCGNITQESFISIWNNPAYTAHRKRLSGANGFPICTRCCSYFRRD